MLKYDIKNYFQNFTKNIITCFQWNRTHADLVMCLTWTAICLCQYGILSNKNIHFIGLNLLDKIRKSYKLFKIQGTGCHNINVTFISSSKDGLLHFAKFEFRQISSFFWIWNKNRKVFGKNTVTLWYNIPYMVSLFLLHYIWKLWL